MDDFTPTKEQLINKGDEMNTVTITPLRPTFKNDLSTYKGAFFKSPTEIYVLVNIRVPDGVEYVLASLNSGDISRIVRDTADLEEASRIYKLELVPVGDTINIFMH